MATLPAEGFADEERVKTDQPEAEETAPDDDQPEVKAADDPLPVSPEQIDAILEQVINDKFGGKIENVIYEAIEKAVSKEIDRLKDALLDAGGSGGDQNE